MKRTRKYVVAGFFCLCLVAWGAGCDSDKKRDTAQKQSVKQKIPVEKAEKSVPEKTTEEKTVPGKKKSAASQQTVSAAAAKEERSAAAPAPAENGKMTEGSGEAAAGDKSASDQSEEATEAEKEGEEVTARTSADREAGLPERPKEKKTDAVSAEAPAPALSTNEMEAKQAETSSEAAGKATEPLSPESGEEQITEAESGIQTIDKETLVDDQGIGDLDLDIDFGLDSDASAETATTQAKQTPETYNPFAPLFRKEEGRTQQGGVASDRKRKRAFITPLERIGLGQVTLKGIIRAQSGNRAIVADADGKGYVLKKGTYIGLHSGRVEKITGDRVIIEEIIDGRESVAELKLQKSAGE